MHVEATQGRRGASRPAGLTLTYVGHATVLVAMDGVRLLTDPLLRWRLGPLLRYAAPPTREALEPLDAILVSHAHIDHLDLRSLRRLDRSSTLVVPCGSARTVRRLGYARVLEVEVGDRLAFGPLAVRAVPADHLSQRYPTSRVTPSVGFVVEGSRSVYFAGDSGLFDGMAEIGPFLDVALLPISGWGFTLPADHLNPRSAAVALQLLRPHVAVPVHWGTYFAPGLPRVWKGRDADPPYEFARHAAKLAPHVCVRVLRPGESLRLAGG